MCSVMLTLRLHHSPESTLHLDDQLHKIIPQRFPDVLIKHFTVSAHTNNRPSHCRGPEQISKCRNVNVDAGIKEKHVF